MVGRDLRTAFRRVLLFANVAVGVGAALFCLAAWLAPESLSVPAHSEPGVLRVAMRGGHGAGLAALCGALLLTLDVLWLVYGNPPKEPTTHIVSRGAGGDLKVSREALEAGLRSAGEGLDEISRLRIAVAVSSKMKRVVVRAFFQCPDGVSIQLAGQRLRDTLRTRFAELVRLGDSARLEIDIEFVGFAGRLRAQPANGQGAESESEPEVPFTGPRYPIDEDS